MFPEDGWRYRYTFFRKTLTDGTRAKGDLMRRRGNGETEWRRPTPLELYLMLGVMQGETPPTSAYDLRKSA